jgi:23S rRNA pseudouridine1911/1915/1917 synthase
MSVDSVRLAVDAPQGRLDRFLALRLPHLSREFLQKLIREGLVRVDGALQTKPSRPLKAGSVVEVEVPPPVPMEVFPEDLAIPVLYEDEALAVVDKPAGMSVHPGAGITTGTLVNALLHRIQGLSGIGGVERPGIVHRLDKETSGLIVIAKNDAAHQALSKQFATRRVKKVYYAVAHGIAKQDFTADMPIGRDARHRKRMTVTPAGRMAVTDFIVERHWPPHACLLQCRPLTGRTHQIRVHLAAQGHPIVGDKTYGGAPQRKAIALLRDFPRHALHAGEIRFVHPLSGRELRFECPLPGDMTELMAALDGLMPPTL